MYVKHLRNLEPLQHQHIGYFIYSCNLECATSFQSSHHGDWLAADLSNMELSSESPSPDEDVITAELFSELSMGDYSAHDRMDNGEGTNLMCDDISEQCFITIPTQENGHENSPNSYTRHPSDQVTGAGRRRVLRAQRRRRRRRAFTNPSPRDSPPSLASEQSATSPALVSQQSATVASSSSSSSAPVSMAPACYDRILAGAEFEKPPASFQELFDDCVEAAMSCPAAGRWSRANLEAIVLDSLCSADSLDEALSSVSALICMDWDEMNKDYASYKKSVANQAGDGVEACRKTANGSASATTTQIKAADMTSQPEPVMSSLTEIFELSEADISEAVREMSRKIESL